MIISERDEDAGYMFGVIKKDKIRTYWRNYSPEEWHCPRNDSNGTAVC